MTENSETSAAAPDPRKGMPSPRLDEAEFKRRFRGQYTDPAFGPLQTELDSIAAAAWDAYENSRKAPHTAKAGPGYADPGYDLSKDWIGAKAAIDEAQREFEDRDRRPRVLLINASSRSEHTCPGEMSKSYRLVEEARAVFEEAGIETEMLDLSRIASEYGRTIHPCKACFSTSAALCHWPCSCYPNYSLGQTQDWMNDIYPMWVRADGVLIITPVNWYQVTSPLKLMMDRLVCADGGNPDPTSTHGKDAKKAKQMELDGWDYPRHLEGRLYGVIVHGDTEGAEGVRRALCDWMSSMKMISAGTGAALDRYIGYWKPYATSHDELDTDRAVMDEARNVALTLREAIEKRRTGWREPGEDLEEPRAK